MDSKHVNVFIILFSLACVVQISCLHVRLVETLNLSSIYKQTLHGTCSGDNLIKIYTNNCTTWKPYQCRAACGGSYTNDNLTRFTLVPVKKGRQEKTCIQFLNGRIHYALRVTRGRELVFEDHQCQRTSDDHFLFIQNETAEGRRIFRTTVDNNMMCVGVNRCSAELVLINTTNIQERLCQFDPIHPIHTIHLL